MNKTIVIPLCFCAAVVCAAVASAIDTKPLDATYAVTGEYIIDPVPEDKSRVAIYIKGDSARQIYDAIMTPERVFECNGEERPDEGTRKTAGGLECFHNKDGYYCGVRITLDKGVTEPAYACD